ncbi:MAG: Crp/Fnr family transcriptional regulator [Magnetococcales bacterium]|nr:Crp/Fnr family transcriptional regulator [Magnetococcales bacterium]MBF0157136.1 Crp/Fnr family transcriptional regulator [Magnetococcales bacterium]
MSQDLERFLADSRAFDGIPASDLRELALRLEKNRHVVKQGEAVFLRGDRADRAWIVRSGDLLIQVKGLRHPFRHIEYEAGTVIALQGLLDPGSPHQIAIIAESDALLYDLTPDIVALLSPTSQGLFWKNIAGFLIKRLAHLRAILDE